MGLPARLHPSSPGQSTANLVRPALFADYLPASPVEQAPATANRLPILLLKAIGRGAFVAAVIAAPVAVWASALR